MTIEEYMNEVDEAVKFERTRLRKGWETAEAIRTELEKMDERISKMIERLNQPIQ